MDEFKRIKIRKFRDHAGLPTCAKVWGVENCPMLRVAGMCEKQEICGFLCDNLNRRGPEGTLIPHDNCPVWNESEEEND